MNRATLVELLRRLEVSAAAFSLDPTPLSEGVVLERTRRGSEVSYRERGQASSVRLYCAEEDACWDVLQRCVEDMLLSDGLRLRRGHGSPDTTRVRLLRAIVTHESHERPQHVTPQRLNLANLALLLDRLGVQTTSLALGREDPAARYSLWESPHGWAIRSRESAPSSTVECRYFATESDACWTLARWLIEDASARGGHR